MVINGSDEDPVDAVRQLTDGKGADLVVDCVGGYAGINSFEQAQDMVRAKGTIQLIAAYQQAPLPLHSSKIMHKRLIAGDVSDVPQSQRPVQALEKIRNGEIQVAKMITHRFPFMQAKEAFDFLWNTPGEALAVLLTWR